MKLIRLLSASAAVAVVVALTACASPAGGGAETPSGPASSGGNVIAPVVMTANDLQGATVDLVVGQVLDIDTGDLAVDSYTAKIDDEKVAEFVQGRDDGSAVFNPGLTALAEGSTKVVLTNAQGGIQPLDFTVSVVPR